VARTMEWGCDRCHIVEADAGRNNSTPCLSWGSAIRSTASTSLPSRNARCRSTSQPGPSSGWYFRQTCRSLQSDRRMVRTGTLLCQGFPIGACSRLQLTAFVHCIVEVGSLGMCAKPRMGTGRVRSGPLYPRLQESERQPQGFNVDATRSRPSYIGTLLR
jgi:hypothetical protein